MSNFYTPQKFFNTLTWKIQLVVALFTSMILAASMVLPWFYQFRTQLTIDPSQVIQTVELNAMEAGFGPFVFLSILSLLVWAGLSAFKPSRIGGVIVAWFGSWWLMLSLAAITSREQFLIAVSKYFDIPNIYFGRSVFNFLENNAFGDTSLNQVGVAWLAVGLAGFMMVLSSIYIIREANRLS